MRNTRKQCLLFSFLAACWLFVGPSTLIASNLEDEEKEPATEEEEEKEKEEEKEEEDADRWHAIVGGDIHTGTGAVLKGATMLSLNGKIVELGYNVYVPEEAEVLNAEGFRVYPGLVAIASTGLFGSGGDLENSVDPYDQGMMLGLASGITSAVQGTEIAKLKRGSIEDLVMGKNFFQTMRYGSNSPRGKVDLRTKFEKAAEYLRILKVWEASKDPDKGKKPKTTGIDRGVLAVLNGERRAYFSESQRGDLREIARLAQRFGFRPVINGGMEAWTVADELGRAGATVILTPRTRSSKDERLVREGGSSIENAAILHKSGVQVVVRTPSQGNSTMGGIAGSDILALPISAAFAMRGGLSEQAALEAITVVPARLCGVSHRIGSLQVGMDADCIVTDGDLLHYSTFVQWAVVDGRMVYDKQAEMYFAHIRPRTEVELAPEEKVDPGEAVPEGEEAGDAGEGSEEGESEEESSGEDPKEDPETEDGKKKDD